MVDWTAERKRLAVELVTNFAKYSREYTLKIGELLEQDEVDVTHVLSILYGVLREGELMVADLLPYVNDNTLDEARTAATLMQSLNELARTIMMTRLFKGSWAALLIAAVPEINDYIGLTCIGESEVILPLPRAASDDVVDLAGIPDDLSELL